MEVEKICWGLLYNTDKETIRMPPPKVEKALHMLADPNLDYGRRDIDYKFLEQYRGNQQYWTIVMPAMVCTLHAADALLKGGAEGGKVRQGKSDAARGRQFVDFWSATELARTLVASETQWETRFSGLLAGVLSVRERMALPGSRVKLVWVTGDATLERIATVDWTHRKAAWATCESSCSRSSLPWEMRRTRRAS